MLRVSDLCGFPWSSFQPWAPRGPAWVTNQFLWFPASHTYPEPAHKAWNLFPICCHGPPHSPQPSTELLRVKWLPALYFSFLVGSLLSTFIPLKILLSHTGIYTISLTPLPVHMPLMPPSQASQLPWQCLGHVHALKQIVYVLLW